MAIIWSVNDYFNMAGSLNAENLSGNIFLNFSLLSLTELPSVFIGQAMMDRFGRRWVHSCCMVMATLPLMASVFMVSDTANTSVLVMSLMSKVASNVAWFIMWVQCIEVLLLVWYVLPYYILIISRRK